MPSRYLLILFTLLLSQAYAQKTTLFPIRNGQFWGFIDTNGREVIKPKYYAVGHFVEGLCPARLNGTYGYIDSTGKYVIEAQYDYALPFENGQAKVFIDAKPYMIDKKGKIKFEHNFREIYPFGKRSYTRVKTYSGKMGVINLKGELVADTIFRDIKDFVGDAAIVTGLNDNNTYKRDTAIKDVFEMGLIDSCGKWLIKYGMYDVISDFNKEYAYTEVYTGTHKNRNSIMTIIDTKGNNLLTIPEGGWYLNYYSKNKYGGFTLPYFNEGLAAVIIESEVEHGGLINTKGEVVYSNKSFEKVTSFSSGYGFGLDSNGRWHLINSKGVAIDSAVFEEVYLLRGTDFEAIELPFINGMAIVKTNKGWCGVDTMGKVVTTYQQIEENPINTYWPKLGIDDILVIQNNKILNQNIDLRKPRDEFNGIWNVTNGTFQNISFYNLKIFKNTDKLISVHLTNGITAYINQSGKIVWKENKRESKNKTLNLDYRLVANHDRNIMGPDTVSTTSDIPNIVLIPKNDSSHQPACLIVHNVPYEHPFDYFLLQAKDKKGVWQYIEYTVPVSIYCSFGDEPPAYSKDVWSFELPEFEGEFKTKLRAKFYYANASTKPWDGNFNYSDDIGDADFNEFYDFLYSSEIDVQINPGQLWRRNPEQPDHKNR